MKDNSAVKNVLWNTTGSIFYCICQWLITVIVVHISSYEDAGYLSLAMTTSSSFSAISLFSMRNYQVSDVNGRYTDNIYIGSRGVTCLIAFAACIAASFRGNSLYQVMCIAAFMLIRVAEAVVDVMHGVDQKHDRYDYIGISYILRGFATAGIFVIGFLLTEELVYTLFIVAFCNLMIAAVYDVRMTYSLERFRPEFWSGKVIGLLKECTPIVIFAFLLSLINLIPKNILQQLCGAEALGVYSSMASPTLVVQVFSSVAFNPFIPRFSKAYAAGDMALFRKMLHGTYALIAAMCLVVTAGAAVFGRTGLKILFGEDILVYYNLFMPIVWCTILTGIVWILSAVMVLMRNMKWLLLGMAVDFAVCAALARDFIVKFEKNGVSLIQIFTLAVYVLFMVVVCEVTVLNKKRKGAAYENRN